MQENSSNMFVVGLHRIHKDKERTEKMRLFPLTADMRKKIAYYQ